MIIDGTPNKLGSLNEFSKLVIIDPSYTTVSPTLGFRGWGFGSRFSVVNMQEPPAGTSSAHHPHQPYTIISR